MQNVQDEFGPILASREMSWDRGDGVVNLAYAEIGEPFEHNIGSWECRVRTRGLGDNAIRSIYGADSIQVLYLALAFAGVLVKSSLVSNSLDCANEPNFGFPEMPPNPIQGEEGQPCLEPIPPE